MRRLLFLNGIKAFEAAARTGSFAAAGAELNVSAAAVSRMVHLLEERLGVALFERKANKLVPTAAGRAAPGAVPTSVPPIAIIGMTDGDADCSALATEMMLLPLRLVTEVGACVWVSLLPIWNAVT